ncbi:MAG TPA: hypothetical protein VFZ81_13260, partial [Burkholderiales bacterium]
YSEFLPEEGQARGVQIDIDGRMLSLRYPMEVNLVGGCRCRARQRRLKEPLRRLNAPGPVIRAGRTGSAPL